MSGVLRFVIGLSLAGGATCLVVYALGLPFRKLVKKSWLFYIWLVVLLRFVIPVPLNLPFVTDSLNSITAVISSAAAPAPIPVSNGIADAQTASDNPASNGTDQASHAALIDNNAAANAANGATNVNSAAETAAVALPDSNTDVTVLGALIGSLLLPILPYLWLFGASAMLIWTVTGYALTVTKLRRGRILVMRGRVPVYESSQITTPILAGILHPAIYLPMDFPNPALAIRHELTHLRRGDLWLKWLVQLTVCVHWFNPLAWLMKRDLNKLCELACDSTVVRYLNPSEQHAYGQMLLDTAYAVSDKSGILIASLGKDKCLLAERITEIVTIKKTTRKTVAAMSVLAILILASAVVFGSLFSGCTDKSETASPQASPSVINTDTANPSATETTSTYTIPIGTAPGFENDPNVIGTWTAFAYTNSIAEFTTDGGYMPFSGYALVAYENGWTNEPYRTWSKGFFNYYDNQLSTEYDIREIDGRRYLFVKALSENRFYAGESHEYAVYQWSSEPIHTSYYSDDIDLPFVDDPAVLGTWKTVSAVQKISDFDPGKLNESNTEITFLKNGEIKNPYPGKLVKTGLSWTKGFLINSYNITASAYAIKDFNGVSYMFVEVKNNGDYTHQHHISAYAVWQVTETAPASPGASSAFPNGSVFVTMGSFDAPLFDDDPGVIGRWQLVDIVDRITSFNPKKPQYTGEFHKWELTFCIDGVRGGVMAMFTLPDGYQQTQDHLDYPFLESAGTHEFKEIDGVRYMFVEDKSSADNTNYVVWKQS